MVTYLCKIYHAVDIKNEISALIKTFVILSVNYWLLLLFFFLIFSYYVHLRRWYIIIFTKKYTKFFGQIQCLDLNKRNFFFLRNWVKWFSFAIRFNAFYYFCITINLSSEIFKSINGNLYEKFCQKYI